MNKTPRPAMLRIVFCFAICFWGSGLTLTAQLDYSPFKPRLDSILRSLERDTMPKSKWWRKEVYASLIQLDSVLFFGHYSAKKTEKVFELLNTISAYQIVTKSEINSFCWAISHYTITYLETVSEALQKEKTNSEMDNAEIVAYWEFNFWISLILGLLAALGLMLGWVVSQNALKNKHGKTIAKLTESMRVNHLPNQSDHSTSRLESENIDLKLQLGLAKKTIEELKKPNPTTDGERTYIIRSRDAAPAKINRYFNSPNPTDQSFNDQNGSSVINKMASTYEITLDRPDSETATFRLLANMEVLRKILFTPETYIEPMCQAENAFNPMATSIGTLEDGVVKKRDGIWYLEKKARIGYDVNSPAPKEPMKPTALSNPPSESTSKLESEIKALQLRLAQSEKMIEQLKNSKTVSEIEVLVQNRIEQLKNQRSSLEEAVQVSKPPPTAPAKINRYFTAPHSEGSFFDKNATNTPEVNSSIYKFTLENQDSQFAEFELYVRPENIRRILNLSETYISPACVSENSSTSRTRDIKTLECGEAEKQGDMWVITEKARIRYE